MRHSGESPVCRPCSSCGTPQPQGNRFCANCGGLLADVAPAAPSAPHPVQRPYTPHHVASELLRRPDFVEGERKNITTLFVDVKGSMEIVEDLDPEHWHRVLDGFFRILGEGVHLFGGTINQYTGDGIMALFGAPISHEDHAQRACCCSLQLREAVRAYARELKREYGIDFLVRMGISTGDVVVGSIGDELRTDYTAQGRTVGLGARLMQLAPPEMIYVAPETAAIVSDYFEIEDLGEFKVKGVRDRIHVYQLHGDGDARTRFDASRKRGLSPFIGRENEMRVLEDALSEVRVGEGRVLGLCGDAGIGKSRLFHEFTERCRAAGIRVMKGRAGARGAEVVLQPLLQAAQDYFGIAPGDEPDLARQKIAGRVLLADESARDDLPMLFDFLGVRDPNKPPEMGDPKTRQSRIVALLERHLCCDDGEDAIVTVVEDLHWADEASVRFLERWVDAIAGKRFLLLVNFRPGFNASWMHSASYRQIFLEPLSESDSEKLAAAMLGPDPSVASLAQAIARRSGGNAFFLEEIVQTLVDSGRLRGARGRFQADAPIGQLPVPATVRDTVAARIDRLDLPAKRVLQAAAVIGRDCDLEVLREVVGANTSNLLTIIDTLQDSRLLVAESLYPQARFGFTHALIREVACESQLATRLQLLHRRIAEVLTERAGTGADCDAGRIASHWEACGATAEAARWHATAAERTGPYDTVRAVLHWRKVRQLADGADAADARLSACGALIRLGPETDLGEKEGEEIFEEGLKLAQSERDRRAMALLFDGYASMKMNWGHQERALSYSLAANRLADNIGDASLKLALRAQTAERNSFAGRVRENIPWVERALAEASVDRLQSHAIALNDPYTVLVFHRALLAIWSGDLERARRELNRVLKLGQDRDVQSVVGWAHAFFPELASFTGEDEAALEHARVSFQIAERIGSRNSLAIALRALGAAHALAGAWNDATQAFEDAIGLVRHEGTLLQMESELIGNLGAARLGAGDPGAALELAEEAIEIGARQHARLQELRGHLVATQARLARDTSAPGEIAHGLEVASRIVDQSGASSFEPVIAELRAELALRLGKAAEFRSGLEQAAALHRRIGAEAHCRRIEERLQSV